MLRRDIQLLSRNLKRGFHSFRLIQRATHRIRQSILNPFDNRLLPIIKTDGQRNILYIFLRGIIILSHARQYNTMSAKLSRAKYLIKNTASHLRVNLPNHPQHQQHPQTKRHADLRFCMSQLSAWGNWHPTVRSPSQMIVLIVSQKSVTMSARSARRAFHFMRAFLQSGDTPHPDSKKTSSTASCFQQPRWQKPPISQNTKRYRANWRKHSHLTTTSRAHAACCFLLSVHLVPQAPRTGKKAGEVFQRAEVLPPQNYKT